MNTALLVIDVQMAFVDDDNNGASRSCPQAEKNVAALLEYFRQHEDKVVHIHHHGLDPDDPFHADAPGSKAQPFAMPRDDEDVVIKHVASAFVGTNLEKSLRSAGINRLVICGATANHCAESTARSAGNLGFETIYISDAVWAYAATGPDGLEHDAQQIHSITLCNLHGEFASVMPTTQYLS